jgi:hypothetical protein
VYKNCKRERSRCNDFGGSGICQHNCRRSPCKYCWGPSASIVSMTDRGAAARTAMARASASIIERGAAARTAGAPPSCSINQRQCKTSQCKECGEARIALKPMQGLRGPSAPTIAPGADALQGLQAPQTSRQSLKTKLLLPCRRKRPRYVSLSQRDTRACGCHAGTSR